MDTEQSSGPVGGTAAGTPRGAEPFRDRVVFAGLSVAAIWVSVAMAGIFAPDLVSGTQQEHVPVPALIGWIGGLSATKSVLAFSRRAPFTERWAWTAYALGVGAVWLAVALVSIFVPVWLTGTDPTRLPIAAIIAPFAGAAATGLIGEFVTGPTRSSSSAPTDRSAPSPA